MCPLTCVFLPTLFADIPHGIGMHPDNPRGAYLFKSDEIHDGSTSRPQTKCVISQVFPSHVEDEGVEHIGEAYGSHRLLTSAGTQPQRGVGKSVSALHKLLMLNGKCHTTVTWRGRLLRLLRSWQLGQLLT